MEVLDTLLCKKFKDEDIFLEKVQDILNYDIIEYIYRDVYYFLEDDAICILDIEY